MPDIFDEVAEDLRTERMQKFLLRYAGAFLGAAILVLAGIGVWKFMLWHQHQQDLRAAEQYLHITDRLGAAGPGLTKAGKISDAKDLLAFAASAPNGYASLARLRAAALYRDAGDATKAEAIWSTLGAANSQAGPMIRDLANLLLAQNQMGHAPNAAVIARLKPLMNPNNPFHDLAQFDTAVLDLQANHDKEAKALLQRVSDDPKTPAKLRQLAQGLLADLIG